MKKSTSTGITIWFLALALAWALVAIRFSAPAPISASASPETFSAERAHQVLLRLWPDDRPHPAGSAANRELATRIVAELKRLGLKPEVRPAFACKSGMCADLQNLMVRIPGTDPDLPAVAITAHYDSVAAGPGISDDLLGVVAVLETARALSLKPHRRSIVILLTDGEEFGLLGAAAHYVQKRRDLERFNIDMIINAEARGTEGPSLMFEIAGDTDLLRAFASASPRPFTSSLFSTVYELLPNDTDFTVHRRHGLAGVNLAFIEGAARYHTPLDNRSYASLASLQHHGGQMHGLALAAADSEVNFTPAYPTSKLRLSSPKAVWFDFLGLFVVIWPSGGWSIGLALFALLLHGGNLWRRSRADVHSRREVLSNFASATLRLFGVLLASGAFAAAAVIGCQRIHSEAWMPWYAHPTPYLIVCGAIALAAVLWIAPRVATTQRPWLNGLVWSWFAALALLVAVLFEPACHLLVVPALVAGVVVWLPTNRFHFVVVLPVLVAGAMWFRLAVALVHAVGFFAHAGIAIAIALPALLGCALLPLRSKVVRPRWAAIAVVVVGVMGAVLSPAYSAASPQRMSLAHVQVGERAFWYVDARWGKIPPEFAQALGEPKANADQLPWARGSTLLRAPAATRPESGRGSAGPTVTCVPFDHNVSECTIQSSAKARFVVLAVPADARGHVSVSSLAPGEWPAAKGERLVFGGREYRAYSYMLPNSEPTRWSISLLAGTSILVLDGESMTPQTARVFRDVLKKRPDWAGPSQGGDMALIGKWYRLPNQR